MHRPPRPLFFLIGFFVGFILFLIFVPAERILESIGVRNTYLFIFLLALLGGISVVTSGPFYASVAALANEAINFPLLVFMGGIGIFLSDCIFFFLVRYGKTALKGELFRRVEYRLEQLIGKLHGPLLPLCIYLYASLPLPSDILMAALAMTRVPFVRFAPFIFAGNMTVVALVSYFGPELLQKLGLS